MSRIRGDHEQDCQIGLFPSSQFTLTARCHRVLFPQRCHHDSHKVDARKSLTRSTFSENPTDPISGRRVCPSPRIPAGGTYCQDRVAIIRQDPAHGLDHTCRPVAAARCRRPSSQLLPHWQNCFPPSVTIAKKATASFPSVASLCSYLALFR